jgi:hypothetical protein
MVQMNGTYQRVLPAKDDSQCETLKKHKKYHQRKHNDDDDDDDDGK